MVTIFIILIIIKNYCEEDYFNFQDFQFFMASVNVGVYSRCNLF